jgi:hypothetical protein
MAFPGSRFVHGPSPPSFTLAGDWRPVHGGQAAALGPRCGSEPFLGGCVTARIGLRAPCSTAGLGNDETRPVVAKRVTVHSSVFRSCRFAHRLRSGSVRAFRCGALFSSHGGPISSGTNGTTGTGSSGGAGRRAASGFTLPERGWRFRYAFASCGVCFCAACVARCCALVVALSSHDIFVVSALLSLPS